VKGIIFTYLLSYGGSVAALLNPVIGLCIYYCFVVLRPQDLWSYSLEPGGTYSRYVALAALIGWALRGFSGRAGLRVILPVVTALAGFMLVIRISAWFALDSSIAEPVTAIMLKMFLMFVIGLCLITTIPRLRAIIWVFLLSQGYLAHEINLRYFLDGINIVVSQDGFGPLNNNTFALSLLPGIGLAFMAIVFERRLWLRLLAGYVAISSIHVILLSESRGAYLGLLAMGILSTMLVGRSLRSVLVILVVASLAIPLVGASVRKEFMTMFGDQLDDSAASRTQLWRAAYRTMMDHPLLGVGPENFAVVSEDYLRGVRELHGVEAGRAAHNLYLQIGADCGIPGLALLLLFYFRALNAFWRFIRRTRDRMFVIDPMVATATTGALVGIIGFLIHSIFSAHPAIETPYLAILIGSAAVRLYCLQESEPAKQQVV
jgi:O-antigen ligase